MLNKESKLLKNLSNYELKPADEIRRKMDYFYGPYNPEMHTKKHMHYENGSDWWVEMKRIIFKTEKQIFDEVKRGHLL